VFWWPGISGACVIGEPHPGTPGGLRDEGSTCKGKSFTADTPVLIATAVEKAIKDVKLGDLVMAQNPVTESVGRGRSWT
jgi:hypothetical protein